MKNDFEDYLAECLKNPEFKKHWEEQLAELEKERERIKKELVHEKERNNLS